MEHAVRALAALHACRWNDDSLHDVDFLIPLTAERARFLGDLALTATEQFIARFGSRLEDADISTLRAVAEVLGEWQGRRATPFSLMHGDYRLDNLMFAAAGDDVVAVDWQTVTVALPARDLSYFIGTSLPVEQRRVEEHRLVQSYHDELRARGVEEYSLERCFGDYRFGQLQGPMITVLGCMTSSGRSSEADDMFLAMATRSCAAIRDLGSMGVL
jgi:aminoglycoside phosphotransferase (APT) family kinase protein